MNHIKEIEVGHEYQIIDRATGEFGNSCSSGVYFARMQTRNGAESQIKLMLMK